MIPYLVPFERVGDSILATNVYDYKKTSEEFEFYEDDANIGWITYDFRTDKISLYANKENNKIECISCKEELIYKGRNLIGLSLDEFILHVGEECSEPPDELDF